MADGVASQLAQRLPQLQALLALHQFARGPDAWVNVYDLLYRLDYERRAPPHPAAYKTLLGPLICRDPNEQRQFERLFDAWLTGTSPAVAPADAPRADTQAAATESFFERYRRRVSPWWLVPLLAASMALLTWVFYEPATPVATPQPEPTPITEATQREIARPAVQPVVLPPRQPREPAPTPTLAPDHRAQLDLLGKLAPWLPVLLALVWLLLRYRARPVLHAAAERADARLNHLRLDDRQVPLFAGQPSRRVYRDLRQPLRLPSRRLDVRATVEATTRHAGYCVVRYADRAHLPEYLVLIDRAHRADHSAALGDALAARLHEEGLPVHAYSYRGNPQRLYRPQRPDLPRLDLHEVAARHERSRLLLVGDGEGLLQAFSGRPQVWLDAFERWPWRAFLSTAAADGDDVEQTLDARGFAVAPLSAAGLEHIVAVLSRAPTAIPDTPPSAKAAWPAILERHDWLHRVPPHRGAFAELQGQLADYLGPAGLLLLRAMAAYPGVHWGLTRALDYHLNPGDRQRPEVRDPRLLAIARLPWAREGYMPKDLRLKLLRGLRRSERRAVRQVYSGIMAQLTRGRGDRPSIELPIAVADRQATPLWGELSHRVAKDSPLNDRIFATLLRGGRPGSLEFELSQRVARLLGPAPSRVKWIPGAAILIGAAALGLVLGWGWQQGLRPIVEEVFAELPAMPPSLAATEIRIRYAPALFQQANALKASLADWDLAPPTMETDQANGRTQNRVRYANPALAAAARFVAERLGYLTYGAPLEVVEEPGVGGIRVELFADHAAGGVFRDPLRHAWQPASKTAEPAVKPTAPTEAAPADLASSGTPDSETPFEVQVLPSLRDPLRGGGEGPEMVVLPAGSFVMGSPEDEAGRDVDEGPQRRVQVPAFAIGRTEVTFADYDRFAKATQRQLADDEGWGRGARPVINVSWDDAAAYAAWLSEQSGQPYRLPSEAEWEYAARAGTTTSRSWGDDPNAACRYANVYDQVGKEALKWGVEAHDCSDGEANTAPIGRYDPNGFGLYDLLGNVWEWVGDCYFDSHEGAPADVAVREASNGGRCLFRGVRGGGWDDHPRIVRSAIRDRVEPDGANNRLGFRLARTLP